MSKLNETPLRASREVVIEVDEGRVSVDGRVIEDQSLGPQLSRLSFLHRVAELAVRCCDAAD